MRRKPRPSHQSRHVPIGVLGFSPLDAGETGLVGAVSQEAPLPLATTTETLITPHNKEISDQPLVIKPNATLLGVTLDPMLMFRNTLTQ